MQQQCTGTDSLCSGSAHVSPEKCQVFCIQMCDFKNKSNKRKEQTGGESRSYEGEVRCLEGAVGRRQPCWVKGAERAGVSCVW